MAATSRSNDADDPTQIIMLSLFDFLLYSMVLMLAIPFTVIGLAYLVRDREPDQNKKDQ